MSGRRVLITGTGGQLGRAVGHAAPDGVTVVAKTRADLDIAAPEAGQAIADIAPDMIVNCAAFNDVDGAERDDAPAIAVNANAVERLAQTGIPLVHISTDYVFDGNASRPIPTDAEPAPINAYGRSKLAGEQAALAAGALVIRTAWLYSGGSGDFVGKVLAMAGTGDPMRMVCDETGTPTRADSLARAIWALVDAGASGLFHYTDAGLASRYDFAVAIVEEARALGLIDPVPDIAPIPASTFESAAARPAYSVLDCHACWAITGTPGHWRTNLRAALSEFSE